MKESARTNLKRVNFSIEYKKTSFMERTKKDFRRNRLLYLMVLPVLAFYILFAYVPMYGVVIAFKDFSMKANMSFFENISNSAFVGVKYFTKFFKSFSFANIFFNTVRISFSTFIFGFPAPIILALLINEIKSKHFKKIVQTASYLPYFISLVVVCGIIKDFTSDKGVITSLIITMFGGEPQSLLNLKENFLPIYIISDIWQGVGWGSIIYLAALTGIDPQLYEAAVIDGARRWKQTIHITLPCLIPTITVMLILRIGGILNVGYEKIILLQNPLIQDTTDVISTYTYRRGLIDRDWSYSAAIGLFNSVINFVFLYFANYISKKTVETSLW